MALFGTPSQYSVGDSPTSISYGDFNKDGKTDILIANSGTSGASLLLANGTGTFNQPQIVGSTQYLSIVTCLANSDGNLDILATTVGGSYAIQIGNGNGTFQNASYFVGGASGQSPYLTASDLNADGQIDLAVLKPSVNSVNIFQGNGNGNFTYKGSYQTGLNPGCLAIKDIDGDGKSDLIVGNLSNSGTPNISLMLGMGDGTFSAQKTYAVASGASRIAVTDINRDGCNDVVVVNTDYNAVSVLLGDGYGNLSSYKTYATGYQPQDIAVSDFDLDGIPDIITSNKSTAESLTLLVGVGDGSFKSKQAIATGLMYARSLASADLNGDNKPDLIVTQYGQATPYDKGYVDIFFNTTNSAPIITSLAAASTPENISVATVAYAAIATDPDANTTLTYSISGGADAALFSINSMTGAVTFKTSPNFEGPIDAGSNNVYDVVVQASDGSLTATQAVSITVTNVDEPLPKSVFGSAVTYSAGANADFIVNADFNGDGVQDLLALNAGVNNASILLGNGNGTFQSQSTVATGLFPTSASVGDFNGDGKKDVAITNGNAGNVSILLGNGNGTFQTASTFTVGTGPYSIVSGDFNQDQKTDLIVVNSTSNSITFLTGLGSGTFQSQSFNLSGSKPSSITAGDFNGDGKQDVAISFFNSNFASVYLGKGDGTFQLPVYYATGNNPMYIASSDFNGDGKVDLVVCNTTSSNSLSVLLGNGDGTFKSALTFAAGSNPNALAISDFDKDGKVDLIICDASGNVATVLLGKGDGTFSDPTTYSTGTGPFAATTSDFNGDGRADVAIANFASNNISILLNNTNNAPSITSGASASTPENTPTTTTVYTATATDPDLCADGYEIDERHRYRHHLR